MLPYTSGTTGKPKACVHTHRTVMTSFVGSTLWRPTNSASVFLAVAPLFHLLGLQTNVNAAIFNGGTLVLMPRWDRETAAELIERHGVTFWAALPTMLVDFFAQPGIEARDLSSLSLITGGGAATPQHVSDLLKQRYGLSYIEGYGLTETASFLCTNPVHTPKRGCLGVPTFGVDARVLDPETLQPVAPGEVGEIVAHAAQIMLGYWNNDKANAESFIVIDGKRFFRTGDLASVDEDGYFFMRDRLKRMINASGFKVWPAEVEAILGAHPGILEACVIAVPDTHRGETVKAVVTLKANSTDSAEDVLAWCRDNMATYKAPRIVQIVDSLPKNATGKIAWRDLQQQELERAKV
jgi:long-chain acyl-CoA synthetase